jgi:glycosyltransferase involved in cell wall biosynthesis
MISSLKKYNKKIELIIFCPSIEYGGVEKNLYTISNYLSKKLKLNIVTANNDKKKFFNKEINFYSPSSSFWNNSPRILKTLICFIILLNNFYKKNVKIISFQSNAFAIIIAKILRAKIIIRSNTSPESYSKNFIKRYILKIIFQKADKIILNSKKFKKKFDSFYNVKSEIIYNPSYNLKNLNNLAKEKIKDKFFKDKIFLKIINIARLTNQKNHLTLLKAIKICSDKKLKIKVMIIGSGYEKKRINNFIKLNKLTDTIKLMGYIQNPLPYIRQANIFALTSNYEGLPNVLIEALSQKKIIVSSNCPTGPSEILLNGRGGYLFKVNNHIQLAKIIINISKNIKHAKRKSEIGFNALKRFSYEKNCNKYYNLITKQV